MRTVILPASSMIDAGELKMANKKHIVELSGDDCGKLRAMIGKGKLSARANLKARILLKADQGGAGPALKDMEICEILETNLAMVARVREKFVTEGLEAVFKRKQRATPPVAPIFDGEAEARLIALACSEPPEGHARWTIRLLAGKVVELKIVDDVHFNTVGRVLKKTNLNRTAARTG